MEICETVLWHSRLKKRFLIEWISIEYLSINFKAIIHFYKSYNANYRSNHTNVHPSFYNNFLHKENIIKKTKQYNRSLIQNPLSNIRICSINLKVDDFACSGNKGKKEKKTFEILCMRIRSKVVSVFLDRGKSFSSTRFGLSIRLFYLRLSREQQKKTNLRRFRSRHIDWFVILLINRVMDRYYPCNRLLCQNISRVPPSPAVGIIDSGTKPNLDGLQFPFSGWRTKFRDPLAGISRHDDVYARSIFLYFNLEMINENSHFQRFARRNETISVRISIVIDKWHWQIYRAVLNLKWTISSSNLTFKSITNKPILQETFPQKTVKISFNNSFRPSHVWLHHE